MLSEKIEKLSGLLSKKVVNWGDVESMIEALGDDINYKYSDGIDDDCTILSELYYSLDFHKCGAILVELTRLFLEHGYDVHANDDFNGAICLHNLCWSSYDKYVLPAAELLLNAGANTHIKIEDDFEDGILNSISWKLGYWHIGEYKSANMFEAYYQMIQAEQAGEDYRGIRDVSDCLDMVVTKVECFDDPTIINNRVAFNDAIVIWFGSTPLVADKRVELIVNPNRVNKNACCIDVSDVFTKIVGQKFIKYSFSNGGCASMIFDNNMKLVLSNNWSSNNENFIGYLDVKSKFAPTLQPNFHND